MPLAAPLALLLAAPAAASRYTATLSLRPDEGLRVVETAGGSQGPLCGPVSRELPLKRLRWDGLRRLTRVSVKGAFRGTGAGIVPAAWSLERTARGAALRVAAAPAPPDCALTLVYAMEPLLDGKRLVFPLPGEAWAGESGSVTLSEGAGAPPLPRAVDPGRRGVFVAELAGLPPPAPARPLWADNLHVLAGAAGLAVVALFYAGAPLSWGALALGGALSAGTAAAMRLAESPADIGPGAAASALLAGGGAALAGALTLALWAGTAVLTRSALRPGALYPQRLWLASVACGFASFGATTWAADLFTRLVRDAAPLALAAGAGHLALHGLVVWGLLRRKS